MNFLRCGSFKLSPPGFIFADTQSDLCVDKEYPDSVKDKQFRTVNLKHMHTCVSNKL